MFFFAWKACIWIVNQTLSLVRRYLFRPVESRVAKTVVFGVVCTVQSAETRVYRRSRHFPGRSGPSILYINASPSLYMSNDIKKNPINFKSKSNENGSFLNFDPSTEEGRALGSQIWCGTLPEPTIPQKISRAPTPLRIACNTSD